jgi:hypothetical protein
MPRPLYPRERHGTHCIGGWVGLPGPFWTGAENLAPTGIWSPDRPACSEMLYRLSYPGPRLIGCTWAISCQPVTRKSGMNPSTWDLSGTKGHWDVFFLQRTFIFYCHCHCTNSLYSLVHQTPTLYDGQQSADTHTHARAHTHTHTLKRNRREVIWVNKMKVSWWN